MDNGGRPEIVSFVTDDEIRAAGETAIRCKFVIVKTPDAIVLAFAPVFRYAYHANILEALCAQKQILTRWERQPDRLEILDPEVTVHGGGHLALTPSQRRAHFGGSSKAYGFFDRDLLRSILQANTSSHFVTVTVEE